MRIGDPAPGQGSGKSSDERKERAAAFCRRRRPGQRIVGRILRRERPGLSWVDFDGQALLADIPSDPDPGQVRLFEVERTEPDILLREIGPVRTAPAAAAADLAAFRLARSRFEAAAADLLQALGALDDPGQRAAAFAQAVAQSPPRAWEEAVRALDALEAAFARCGLGRPGYQPWVLPQARDSELVFLPLSGDLSETALSFTLPGTGAGEVRLLCGPARPGHAGCGARLFLENKALAPAAAQAALALAPAGVRPEMLGCAALPLERRAGVLAAAVAGLSGRGAHFSGRV